ncbi:MAG: hypothetical protein NC834_01030, partial [Candidatus Omnitrophica bacterium]|nr:hypothetical protein [Candidatus Omnitrophota bacterium]
AITGTTIDLGGNITTSDAAGNTVTLTGNVTLSADVTIDTDNTTNDGAVNITGTVNSLDATDRAFTITAGDADVTIGNTIGATNDLASITISGNDITIANIGGAAAGVTGATSITGTDIVGDAATITLTGTTYNANQQTYTAGATGNISLTAGAAVTVTSSADAITFASAVSLGNGADLTINSGGGAVSMQAVDGTSDEDLTINAGAGNVDIDAIGVSVANGINTVAITGTTIDLGGNITTSDAAGNTVTLTGNVTLSADVTIDTDNTSNDGDITFSSTINADLAANNRTLTLDAGTADITISGAIGNTAAIQSLTINDADDVSLQAVTTRDGGITVVTAGADPTITLAGNLSTDSIATAGAVSITGPVTLGANITIDSDAATTDANITFVGTASTINGDFDLTLTSGGGNIDLEGVVGGTTSLDSLFATGNDVDVVAITTNGTQGAAGNGILLRETGTGDITIGGALSATGGNIALSTDTTLTIAYNMSANGDVQIGVNATFANADITDSPTTITHSAGNIYTTGASADDVIIICTTYNQSGTGSIGTNVNPVVDDVFIDPTDVDISGSGVYTDSDFYAEATNNITVGANVTAGDYIGLRADSDASGAGTLTHSAGTILSDDHDGDDIGGIILAGFDITLDPAGGSTAGGVSVTNNGTWTGPLNPPASEFGILIMADNDIIINENLTTVDTGLASAIIIQADADFSDLAAWPTLLQGTGVAPDGTGTITFNSSTLGVQGAGVSADGGISINAPGTITVGATGLTFDADADFARTLTTSLHTVAGFAMLAGGNIDLNADDATITVVNTADAGSGGNIIITADYDFSAHSPADRADWGVTSLASDGAGSIDLGDTSLVTGDGITITSADALTLASMSAPGDISATSTASSVSVQAGAAVAAGTDGTGSLTLTADISISIGAAAAITAGTNVNFNADTTGDDAATQTTTIDVDTGATIAAGIDNNWTASEGIIIDGQVSQGGLINFLTGRSVAPTSNGQFTLEDDGVLTSNGTLIIGASSVLDNINIVNPAGAGSDTVVIAGTINSGGDVTIDLNADTLAGDINFTGAIIAADDVTLTVYSTAANLIEGSGNITADAITLTASHADSSITVNDLTAREWIDIDAGQNVTTGNLSATENAGSGYAIEITTTDGTVTINGTTTANAVSGLNVAIDPADVTINASVEVSGDYSATASNNITVNANVTSTGGSITLTADDDNSGAGNLSVAGGMRISAANGNVTLSGESVTVSDVIAGNGGANTLTITIDKNNDNNGTLTTNGVLKADSVTLRSGSAGASNAVITVNADPYNLFGTLTIDTGATATFNLNSNLRTAGALIVEPPITLRTDSILSGDLSGAGGAVTLSGAVNSNTAGENNLTISTGSGAVSLQAIGTTTRLDSVTIATTGTTTLNGSITAENNIDLSAATNVDLGGNITLTSNSGNIYLNGGDVDGNQTLTLIATSGNVYLDTIGGTVNQFTVSAGGTTYLDGNITVDAGGIDMKGSRNVVLRDNVTLATGGNPIDLGSTNATSVSGDFTLTLNPGAAAITLDNVDVKTLTFSSGSSLTLYGDINVDTNFDVSNITDGDTIILADNIVINTHGANLTGTAEDITGTFDLTINTGVGTVNLRSVGTTNNLSTFTIIATGAVTLNGPIEANDGIDLSAATNVTLAAGSGTFTTSNADVKLNGGAVNGAQAVSITAGTGDVYLGEMGQTIPLASLTVVSADETYLSGSITTTGGISLNDDGIILQTDITLTTTANGDVTLNDLTGNANSLTISSGTGNVDLDTVSNVGSLSITSGQVTFAEAVTAVSGISVTVNSEESITVTGTLTSTGGSIILSTQDSLTVNGAIDNNAGPVTLTANSDGDAEDDNLTLTADVDGTSVTFATGGGASADILVNTAQDNTRGSTTFNGATTLSADVTAINNLTFNGAVTLAGAARTLTSTNAGITLNADVSGAQDLTLSAANGNVEINTVGSGADPTLLDINSATATLDGTTIVTAGNILLDGVGLITLATDVSMTSGGNAINLGSLTGDNDLTLVAGVGVVTLRDADIASLTVTSAGVLTFSASTTFGTTGAVTVTNATTSITVSGDIEAGGAVSLTNSGNAINIDGNITGQSVAVNDVVTLTSTNITAINNITFSEAVNLAGGASNVTSTAGNVTFSSTIDGAQNLTVNADNGTATFSGAIGGTTSPTTLTVTAGDTVFSSTVQVGTGGLSVTGVGTSTTTLTGNITSSGNVLIDDSVVLAGDIIINTETNNSSVEITGLIDGTTANTQSLDIEAGTGAVTLGNSVGTQVTLETLLIDTSGETEINGAIRVGTNVDLDEADDVQLGSNVSMYAGNDILLDVIDGGFTLVAQATRDITANDNIGSTEPLDGLTMIAGRNITLSGAVTSTGLVSLTTTTTGSITVNGQVICDSFTASSADNFTTGVNGDIDADDDVVIYAEDVITLSGEVTGHGVSITTPGSTGDDVTINNNVEGVTVTIRGDEVNINANITGTTQVNITAQGSTAGDDANLSANLSGASVIVTANGSGIILITATQNNTLGSTTYQSAVTINGAITLTSFEDMTFNGDVTVTAIAAGGITSTNGSLDFNGELSGAQDINLNASDGGINLVSVGTTGADPTKLDLDSLTAELGGDINVGDIDTTGVGLTTLAANIIITATDAGNAIQLGDLDGAKTLSLVATNADGDIVLNDADIGALTITDANDIAFNGNFVTSGGISVTGVDGVITIATNQSLQAGTSIQLSTASTGSPAIDINGQVIGNLDVSITVTGSGGDIAVDAKVTAGRNINMSADGDVDVNSAINSTEAGDISITATTGNITLADEVRTTGSGDITMTANAGSINDDDASNEDEYVAGDKLTITAATGIGNTGDIETAVNSLDASVTGTGNIVIDEYDDIVLTDVDTVNGTITISADGQITATDVNASGSGQDVNLSTTTGGMILTLVLADDDITATADAGNITIGVVGDAGTDDISITATQGYIDEIPPGDAGADIVGDVVTLTARDGIGGVYGLETTIASLTGSVNGTGDIIITDTDAIILTNLATTDGSITVSAGGQITATSVNASGFGRDVTLTTSSGGMILTSVLADDDITATASAGNITIDIVGDSGTDDITITATTGAIDEVATNDAGADITGDAVVLTAATGIGSTTAFETEVTTISADATTSGNIAFTELDTVGNGINLLSIDTNNGNITIVTNGGTQEAGTETVITYVISDSGVSGTNDISITALTGDITLAGNTSDVRNVQSDDDITITATFGSITERSTFAVQGDSYVDIQGDKLTITARDEIGSSTGELDIETTIVTLDASSTSSGAIVITETDGITLEDVDTANGPITITSGGAMVATDVVSTTDSDANDITLTATAGDITIGVITAGAGVSADVTITASAGAINEIGAGDAAVDITADVLTMTAQNEIGGTAELDIETTANSITASSTTSGAIYITETNAVNLTSITTTDGLINIVSGGNMTVTLVTAGGDTGSNDDVTLTTTSGDIIMSGDITALNDEVTLISAGNITDTTSGTTDISSANLTITANAGAVGATGTNNELDTDVDTLTVSAQGPVYILEENAITLTSVVTTNGLIDIEAGGTITTTTVTAVGGGVNLNATAGDIFDTAGGLITGGGTSTIKASGIIGTTANPVDVNINGDLWVWAGNEQDEVSAIFNGTVQSLSVTERVEIFEPSPPGLVMLDNRLMGGGNYGSGSTGGSILSRGYGYATIVRSDMFNFYYDRALEPWGYQLSTPWELTFASSTYIDNAFLEGPPLILDGSQVGLNVLPHELLIEPPVFRPEEYYIIRKKK